MSKGMVMVVALLAGVVALLARQSPEIRRYIKIETM
jgi:hypothetical protein